MMEATKRQRGRRDVTAAWQQRASAVAERRSANVSRANCIRRELWPVAWPSRSWKWTAEGLEDGSQNLQPIADPRIAAAAAAAAAASSTSGDETAVVKVAPPAVGPASGPAPPAGPGKALLVVVPELDRKVADLDVAALEASVDPNCALALDSGRSWGLMHHAATVVSGLGLSDTSFFIVDLGVISRLYHHMRQVRACPHAQLTRRTRVIGSRRQTGQDARCLSL